MKKIEIIKENCISCGMCISVEYNQEHQIFGWDDEGKCEVLNQIVNDEVINIANMCPTGAIIITDED